MIITNDYQSVFVTNVTGSECKNNIVNRQTSVFGISGLLINSRSSSTTDNNSHKWILTHGSLLRPNVFPNQNFSPSNASGIYNSDPEKLDLLNFLINHQNNLDELTLIPDGITSKLKFRVYYDENQNEKFESTTNSNFDNEKRKKNNEKNCSLRVLWRCPLLHKTFTDLLFSWSFDKPTNFDKSLSSIFLLLRIEEDSFNSYSPICLQDKPHLSDSSLLMEECIQILRKFHESIVLHKKEREEGLILCRGETVEIESTPFGNIAFMNSVSRGIISNIIGEKNCLILSDANVVPGCEGAPLYLLFPTYQPYQHHQLRKKQPHPRSCNGEDKKMNRVCAGLIISTSLSWCRGERVDYTLAANIDVCLEHTLSLSTSYLRRPSITTLNLDRTRLNHRLFDYSSPSSSLPEILDKSLVVVKCGSGWGTGVVVDLPTGTILTCSHVVESAKDVQSQDDLVKVVFPGRVKIKPSESKLDKEQEDVCWARLIYRTPKNNPYDVAILKLDQNNRYKPDAALRLSEFVPEKGRTVLTVGFPLFAESAKASCSRGVVSRVTESMLQTTCCVQSGTSGGPIIDCETGSILGIVVSNVIATADQVDQNHGPTAVHGQLYPRFNMAVPSHILLPVVKKYLATQDSKCLDGFLTSDKLTREAWNFYHVPKAKF